MNPKQHAKRNTVVRVIAFLLIVALVYGALALLAFNLTSWTLGVLIMGGRAAFSLRRAVLNPGVVGIGLGLLCFLSGLRFPSWERPSPS